MVEQTKKAKGRKPKEGASGYAPLTIRLPDKTRFALELLARAQSRSLSQAVEWALNVGVHAERIGRVGDLVKGTTVGALADKLWGADTITRLVVLYASAPHLLEFDERCLGDLVLTSIEMEGDYNRVLANRVDSSHEGQIARSQAYQKFIAENYAELKEFAVAMSNLGESLVKQSLYDLMARHPDTGMPLLRRLRADIYGIESLKK